MNKIIEFIKKYNFIIMFLAIIILSLIAIRNCKQNADNQAVNSQNINALLDSLRTEKNKANQLTFVNTSYALTIDELKKVNSDLAKELENEKGKSKVFTKIETKIVHDTLNLDNTVIEYLNDSFGLKWDYKKEGSDFYKYLSGETKFGIDTLNNKYIVKSQGTIISKDELFLTVYTNLRESKGKYEITVRSNYPDIKFNPISNIDPSLFFDDKSWGIGFYGGFGMGTRYDGTNGQIGFQVGVGINYNIWTW